MIKIKKFFQIVFVLVFLTSCSNLTNKDNPIINSEPSIDSNNPEKKRMEIKFSCGDDGISDYLDDGWIILKEDSQEKFALGNPFQLQKIVIWKKIKVVK